MPNNNKNNMAHTTLLLITTSNEVCSTLSSYLSDKSELFMIFQHNNCQLLNIFSKNVIKIVFVIPRLILIDIFNA